MRILLFLQMLWISVVFFLNLESIDLLDKGEKPYIPNATWSNAFILIVTGFLLVVFYLLRWKHSYKFATFFAAAFAAWSVWLIIQSNYFAYSTEWWQWGMIMIHLPAILAGIISIFVNPFRKRRYLIYPVHFLWKEE
jgi:hypothetical protein